MPYICHILYTIYSTLYTPYLYHTLYTISSIPSTIYVLFWAPKLRPTPPLCGLAAVRPLDGHGRLPRTRLQHIPRRRLKYGAQLKGIGCKR